MKRLLLILAFLAAVHPAVAADKDKIHRLALQISDNTPEKMTAWWPNSGRRVKTGRISETMPMDGRISTYTSG